MTKASFTSRFVALFVDMIVLSASIFLIMLVFGGLAGLLVSSGSRVLSILALVTVLTMMVLLLLLKLLYFGLLWGSSGQTLGMKLVSIKVVRRSGNDISILRSALRGTIGYWLSAAIFFLGFIWAAIDRNQEAWHDMVFDTWVVEA